MNEGPSAQDTMNQLAGKTLETMTVWSDASQRILRELVELSSGAAKEGLRLCAEMQRTAMDTARETQAATLRWQSSWKELAADPTAWYRKAMTDGVASAQHAFRVAEEHALAMTRAAERVQAAGEAAGKGIQDTCTSVVAKLKEIHAA
jgi:hypothetical protein